MNEMTRELFEKGVKFKHKNHDLYTYKCRKSKDGDHYIIFFRDYKYFIYNNFFTDISHIDDKGFMYYTDLTLGKERIVNVKFSDLVIIKENHIINTDMADSFAYGIQIKRR